MLTTSSIVARQRGHGGALPPRLLLISSDTTIHAPCVRADRLWRPLYQTLDGSVGCRLAWFQTAGLPPFIELELCEVSFLDLGQHQREHTVLQLGAVAEAGLETPSVST